MKNLKQIVKDHLKTTIKTTAMLGGIAFLSYTNAFAENLNEAKDINLDNCYSITIMEGREWKSYEVENYLNTSMKQKVYSCPGINGHVGTLTRLSTESEPGNLKYRDHPLMLQLGLNIVKDTIKKLYKMLNENGNLQEAELIETKPVSNTKNMMVKR